MKKILLLVSIILASVSVNAEKRTKTEMLSVAANVLSAKLPKTFTANSSLKLQVLDNSLSQLTIVGYEKGAFVVVSNDDSMPAVIGYSDSDTKFDLETAAPAFKWYLEIANRNLEERLANGVAAPKMAINPNYKPEVPQLCTTKWGQADPYYRMTPVYGGGSQYVTGCVATAMSQAMKHFNYPEVGRGKITYYFKGEDGQEKNRVGFEDETIDWANMLDVYEPYKFNSDQADAVAYLMKITGASVKMQYSPSGSGAFTPDAAIALRTYFKYDRSVDCHIKDFMSTAEWFDLAYHSLSDGFPLVFGASTHQGGQDAGHSFVVDGYNTDGLVHVNFGWDGEADGHYSLLDMHGYDYGFEMIPVKTPSPEHQIHSNWGLWGKSISYNTSSSKFSATIINSSSIDFTGKIAVILKNLTDGSEQMLGYQNYSDEPLIVDGNRYNVKEFNVQAPLPTDLADGEYRLYLASKGAWKLKDDPTDKHEEPKLYEEVGFQPVHANDALKNSLIITVKDGNISSKLDSNGEWVLGLDNIITENRASDVVKVFDLQGRMIYTAKANEFRIADVPFEGMIIIKNGADVRKVMK